MPQKKRSEQRHTAQEKFDILQEGEYGSMSIPEVCRRNGISTVTYYNRRKQARESILKGFNGCLHKKIHREKELSHSDPYGKG